MGGGRWTTRTSTLHSRSRWSKWRSVNQDPGCPSTRTQHDARMDDARMDVSEDARITRKRPTGDWTDWDWTWTNAKPKGYREITERKSKLKMASSTSLLGSELCFEDRALGIG